MFISKHKIMNITHLGISGAIAACLPGKLALGRKQLLLHYVTMTKSTKYTCFRVLMVRLPVLPKSPENPGCRQERLFVAPIIDLWLGTWVCWNWFQEAEIVPLVPFYCQEAANSGIFRGCSGNLDNLVIFRFNKKACFTVQLCRILTSRLLPKCHVSLFMTWKFV